MSRSLRWTALVAVSLLVGPPADAAPATRDAGKSDEGVEVTDSVMSLRAEVFGAVDEAFLAGRKTEVADLLIDVVDNAQYADFHAEAFTRLGAVLETLDLPYSALLAHERGLSADADIASASASAAIALADRVGDTALLEPVFAANVGLNVDDETRSRMAYLAAREAHASNRLGTASAILKMVSKNDPYFPEASALAGVIMARQGKPESALAPLLTAQAAGKAAGRGKKFDNVMTLNIARSYYAAENWARAIEYYAQLPRGSRQWVDAQFERAWAHFRISDTNGALGMLQTHESPFFENWYFPEAALLRAHSLFLMCKFPEASRQVDTFVERYTPMQLILAEVGARDPSALFDSMRSHVEADTDELPEMITWRFEAEDRFLDALQAVKSAEDEQNRMRNVSSNPFTAWAGDQLDARVAALKTTEGQRIQERARAMEGELIQMLADAEINKLDLLQMEQRLYEMSASRGAAVEAREMVSRRKRIKPNQRWWPWEGEYWQDEVGYYRISAKPDCPMGMQVGTGTN